MSTPNIPSKPPSADGDLGSALSFIMRKYMMNVDGQLPAEIVSYNRATNRAIVLPLISIIGTDGTRMGRAPIAAVPVLAIGGGDLFINFPLGPGDKGWIEASDRDISLFLQSAQMSPPNDGRLHSFEHGRFIPDVYDQYTFTPDAGAMVISTLDGTTRITVAAGKIQIITSNELDLIGQTLNVDMSEAVNINTGSLNIVTTQSSGTGITGTVSLPKLTNIDGVPFPTHQHDSVQPGSGQSGGVHGAP
jgi:hypothetical protein